MFYFDNDEEMISEKKEQQAFVLRWIGVVSNILLVVVVTSWFAKTDRRDGKIEDLAIRMAVQEEMNRTQAGTISTSAINIDKVKERVDILYAEYTTKNNLKNH